VLNIPNALSVSRIPAALFLLALYVPGNIYRASASIAVLLIIVATDILDGFLARKLRVASKCGYLLDGLGDRAVHVAAYLILLLNGVVSALLVWLLVFREISQHAIRCVEDDWHLTQSQIDRLSTRLFTIAVHVALFAEICRTLLAANVPDPRYTITVDIILFSVVCFSFTRIVPRFLRLRTLP
jgi:phosphatidylglycerophosphate synthase